MNLSLDKWLKKEYQNYLDYLVSLKEETYQKFNSKLITTKYELLGIRLPKLRKIAKDISKGNIHSFLKFNNKKYYEAVLIRGLVIAQIKEKNTFVDYFTNYLELIDNWAICDSVVNSLTLVKSNPTLFKDYFFNLVNSKQEYHIRVGLVAILYYYIKKDYLQEIFNSLNNLKEHFFYGDMAAAWLIAEMYVYFKEETYLFLKDNKLNDFIQNKAIQKIKESYRVSKEDKKSLDKLKRGKK